MAQPAAVAKPNRILVVDDRPQNVELLKAHLTKAGYSVETATGGREALRKIEAEVPDLILLDIVMPDVDGFAVCQQVKSDVLTNFIPVVVVTALKDSGDKIRALEVGADDFLSKPFDLYELLARVKSLLRIKSFHDELERSNRVLQRVLNRYMAEDVTSLILDDPDRYLQLGGENRVVTVLFADIRGFTRFSERHPPTEVVDVLNLLFTELTKTIFKYGGTFDKYLGDAIMAFFGAPVARENDALRAVRAAVEMQTVFQGMVERNPNLADLGLGVGVNTGEAIVGNIGSEKIADYTVIGDAANVSRRLQEIAGKGQVLIGHPTYERVKDRVLAQRSLEQAIRGRDDPIVYYELKELLS